MDTQKASRKTWKYNKSATENSAYIMLSVDN